MVLTNGEYLNDDSGELRLFKLISAWDVKGIAYYWVQALNGNYKDELLTFKKGDLYVTV